MGIKFKREDGWTNKNVIFLIAGFLMFLYSFYNISVFNQCKETLEYQRQERINEEIKIIKELEDNTVREENECKAVQSVVFVKTHKTASSTLQNIFLRYGLKHDLKIALPKHNGNRFYYPKSFKKWMIKPFDDDSEPAIIANHLRASPELYETFPGAKRITILRDIPSLYESSFGYMKDLSRAYKKAGTIERFYENPMKFYNEDDPAGWGRQRGSGPRCSAPPRPVDFFRGSCPAPLARPHCRPQPVGKDGNDVFARNHVAFDLGLPWTEEDKIEESIEYLEKTLDLVILSDFFKESMILLRKELCWEWDDVLFFVTNQRSEKNEVSIDLAQKMKEWNAFDTAIYSHFNSTFWKKIEAYENFDEDMKILDEKLEQIKLICLAGERICPPNDSKCQFNPGGGIKLKAFELSETGKKKPLCNYMIMPELTLSKEIFRKQWPGWMKFYEK